MAVLGEKIGLNFKCWFCEKTHPCSETHLLTYLASFVAHLAAMEGQLSCLKFIVSASQSINQLLGARNNNGETPKMLAERFYKSDVIEYVSNIEWERDHPEEAESMSVF